MKDEQIIELFNQRSEKAIVELELKYGGLFWKIAEKFLASREDREECLNDAYLNIWNTIPPNAPNSLAAYGCSIVRNISVGRYYQNSAQKRSAGLESSIDELADCIPSPFYTEDQVNASMLSDLISKFLKTQSKENRVIFMRRFWFLDTYEEISARTGLPVKTVSVRLTRIRKKLYSYLHALEVIE